MPVATSQEGTLREQLRHYEAALIQRALEATGGDRRQAAQRLGIGLSSLYRKLEELERPAAASQERDTA